MVDDKTINKKNRTRKISPKLPLAEYIRRHSPIKAGIRVLNEDIPLAKYNKITNHIFLGNFQAAKDKDLFKTHKIRAVLNCSKEIPNYYSHHKDIEYMRIPVDDSLKQKDYDLMFQYLPVIVEFINKHANIANHNILIHCHAGRQRSAISVAAFMVAKCGKTPQEACKIVMEKRPEAFHFGKSLNFDQALNKYYRAYIKK